MKYPLQKHIFFKQLPVRETHLFSANAYFLTKYVIYVSWYHAAFAHSVVFRRNSSVYGISKH